MPRSQTRTHPRTATRPRYVTLQCPECTHGVRVARDELIEGGAVHCRQCGNEAELTRGPDGDSGREEWLLVDPLGDFDDTEERRA
jgi:transcription elongation factor Elf1